MKQKSDKTGKKLDKENKCRKYLHKHKDGKGKEKKCF